MKSLKQFILEGKVKSFSQQEIKQLFGKVSLQIMKFTEEFTKFLSNLNRVYSMSNNTDREFLYTKFKKECGRKFEDKFLKSLLLTSQKGLSALIIDNIDLINSKLDKEYFTKKESKAEKVFKKWKETDEYVPLEPYNENEEYTDDEELGRAFVIYYAYDPADKSLLRVFRVKGKTNDPNVQHIVNLHKADWNYETKLGYNHANTCKVSYYRKTGKEQLIQDYISNDDIYNE